MLAVCAALCWLVIVCVESSCSLHIITINLFTTTLPLIIMTCTEAASLGSSDLAIVSTRM